MGMYGGTFSDKTAFGPHPSKFFGSGDKAVSALGFLLKIILGII